MARLRFTYEVDECPIRDVIDADPQARRFYLAAMPLVLGVFPAITRDDYYRLTVAEHARFVQVGARLKQDLLRACDLPADLATNGRWPGLARLTDGAAPAAGVSDALAAAAAGGLDG